MTYLHIASRDAETGKASIGDAERPDQVEQIELPGIAAASRYVTLPQVIFLR